MSTRELAGVRERIARACDSYRMDLTHVNPVDHIVEHEIKPLVEAVRKRLKSGHSAECDFLWPGRSITCTCGHDALRAALERMEK